jgi:hypothetical protein
MTAFQRGFLVATIGWHFDGESETARRDWTKYCPFERNQLTGGVPDQPLASD